MTFPPSAHLTSAIAGAIVFVAGLSLVGAGAYLRWFRQAGRIEDRFADRVRLAWAATQGVVREDLLLAGGQLHDMLRTQNGLGAAPDLDEAGAAINLYQRIDGAFARMRDVWRCQRRVVYLKTLCTRLFYYCLFLGLWMMFVGMVTVFIPPSSVFYALLAGLILPSSWVFWLFRNTNVFRNKERELEDALLELLSSLTLD